MDNKSVSHFESNYQLTCIAIDLVHKIIAMVDCKPELIKDAHVAKAYELATQWNEKFIKTFVNPRKE